MRLALLIIILVIVFLIAPSYAPTYTQTTPPYVPTGTMPPSDWHLAPNSPYKNKGADGKDPGADIDAVLRATCGVEIGRPCSNAPSSTGFPRIK